MFTREETLCAAMACLQMTGLQLGHRNENRTLGGGAEEEGPALKRLMG